MTKIFISYRRRDMRPVAGRIYDRLAAKFGARAVFMDTGKIPSDVSARTYLDEAVGQASVVLALVGRGWAEAKDADDFMHIEIESALRRGVAVGAVLINGALMPHTAELPESLRAFTKCNVAMVDADWDFHMHMDLLIADLEQQLEGPSRFAPFFAPKLEPQEPPRDIAYFDQTNRAGAVRVLVGPRSVPAEVLRLMAGSGEGFRDIDIGPEMVVVPAGDFIMGSPEDELERFASEGPQHRVVIPHPFAVSRYAVTFAEWDAAHADPDWQQITGLTPFKTSDEGWGRGDRPVINVSWKDAQAYTKWLREKTGKTYRLLSEAEWEYVCRAGTTTPFWWGTSITPDQANYNGDHVYAGGGRTGENRKQTVPVHSFEPNPWGLYQMHGNVLEWCEDYWNEAYKGAPTDGSPWTTGDSSRRVLRGGSWNLNPRILRAALRLRSSPVVRLNYVGFRLCRT